MVLFQLLNRMSMYALLSLYPVAKYPHPFHFSKTGRLPKFHVQRTRQLSISFYKQEQLATRNLIPNVATYQNEPEEICESALLPRGLMEATKRPDNVKSFIHSSTVISQLYIEIYTHICTKQFIYSMTSNRLSQENHQKQTLQNRSPM